MRALKILLVFAVVLGGLFVAADRVAVNMAEDRVAEKVKNAEGLSGTGSASVSINGFPFLTQLLSKELSDVEVELTGMTARAANRQITVARADLQLTDVRLTNNFSSATAAEASGTADISYADLNKTAPEGMRVEYAGKERAAQGQVKLFGSFTVAGRTVEIPKPIYSTVKIADGGDRVQLHAESLPDLGIPGAEAAARKRTDFGSTISGLPSGLSLEEADVTEKGVTVAVIGKDVELAG